MMVLTGAVTLIGVLSVLELVVLLGVVRKLKEHGAALAASRPAGQTAMQPALRPGQAVGEFEARTLEGDLLARADLSDGTEVGFFSPTCGPCWEKIPGFVQRGASSSRKPLAVVVVTGATSGAAQHGHAEANGQARPVRMAVPAGVPQQDAGAGQVHGAEQSPADLIASDPDAERMVERLREAATVVPDRLGGPMPTAFGVFGFPVSMTVTRDDAGRLLVAGA